MATDGIIFDLDGTLWDSRKMVFHILQHALEDDNESITMDVLTRAIGMQHHAFWHSILPSRTLDDREQIAASVYSVINSALAYQGGQIYPNVRETLYTLSEAYPLFIVSNCHAGYIESFLSAHSFHHLFQDSLSAGQTGQSKAENLATICKKHHINQGVYVGDTVGDQESCQGLHLDFIFASYGFGEAKNSMHAIKHFNELITLIPQLEAQHAEAYQSALIVS